MTTRIKARRVFRLSDSPYYLDQLRSCWQDNEIRKSEDLYDLTNQTRSTILWEFKK